MGGRPPLFIAGAVALLLTVSLLPAPLSATNPPLQPGALVELPDGTCTLNFVFDGTGSLAGEVFIGTAAHCGEIGERAKTPGASHWGTVVFDDDIGDTPGTDFALIQVDSERHGDVSAEMRGHPGLPAGISDHTSTSTGDLLILSGHGLGFHATEPTREKRVATLVDDDDQRYTADGPLVWGDSGGPIVHADTGKALGIVSQFNWFAVPPTTDVGPTVAWAIDAAAQDGWTVQLRTV